jgi:hypothetical protein
MHDKELPAAMTQVEPSPPQAQGSPPEAARWQHEIERLERLFRNKKEGPDDLYLLTLMTRYRKT